jgi:uncharacterized protein YbbK (DUF523 family)
MLIFSSLMYSSGVIMKRTVMICACLAGKKCRYDGTASGDLRDHETIAACRFVTFCPELFGGLSAPRPPAEIQDSSGGEAVLDGKARVLNREGDDVTEAFVRGAAKTLEFVQKENPVMIIMKNKSPSCGAGKIYDGSFSGKVIQGYGVAAALLRRHGFTLLTEDDFAE